jgi:two-component system LytT family sensor kinase
MCEVLGPTSCDSGSVWDGGDVRELTWVVLVVTLAMLAGVALRARRFARQVGSPGQRAVYEAVRTANRAAPRLRAGLSKDSASRAVADLRGLVGTAGLVIADSRGVLACDGVDPAHGAHVLDALEEVMQSGRPSLLDCSRLDCAGPACGPAAGVAAPLVVDGAVVGVLAALDAEASAGLLRLCGEVARFVSTQLELAELDRSRQRAVQAELRFLRAQISPHFIYNALTAIESYVRSDPERARELLVAFAEFTRHSFSSHSQMSTIAEELSLVDTYLELERARFGERINVVLRVAPEVLGVMLPSLVLQPLVENALRHGLEPQGSGTLRIDISDLDSEAGLSVEDDGTGADPVRVARILAGTHEADSVGLRNVDERLRATFGEGHGLLVETAPGAGTKVSFKVPKYHPATALRAGI